ncbi:NAD(P)-dependent oxidoreductase [Thermogemmatispora sp.]|uniref:NAD(P)-dependent oxidoreductase n=1 Tax=Thermogemmatispora sp. TaxID=1968838 RepID=UPI0026159854|nr:NAD(P)-dependent oxidoreductase [Thermogemmatispora sp.]
MTESPNVLGFAGLGRMGLPMARNLLRAGYRLRVYNRTAARAQELVAEGAQRVERPRDLAEPGGIVFSMLADDAALEAVTLGDDGLLAGLAPGGVHVSLSTVSPVIARRMQRLHAERGCAYVAAPVVGRPEAAAAGKLWICLAGEPAARQRVLPLLQVLGQAVFPFGDEPALANVVKLAANFLVGSALEALAEALALAEKQGVERTALMEMLAQTIFACSVYQNYGRMIAERRFTPGFSQRLALKDLGLVLAAADQAQVPMPLAGLVHDRLLSGVARGRGEEDWTALARAVDEAAGLA